MADRRSEQGSECEPEAEQGRDEGHEDDRFEHVGHRRPTGDADPQGKAVNGKRLAGDQGENPDPVHRRAEHAECDAQATQGEEAEDPRPEERVEAVVVDFGVGRPRRGISGGGDQGFVAIAERQAGAIRFDLLGQGAELGGEPVHSGFEPLRAAGRPAIDVGGGRLGQRRSFRPVRTLLRQELEILQPGPVLRIQRRGGRLRQAWPEETAIDVVSAEQERLHAQPGLRLVVRAAVLLEGR